MSVDRASHQHWRKLLERAVDALVAEFGAARARDLLIASLEVFELEHGLIEPKVSDQ